MSKSARGRNNPSKPNNPSKSNNPKDPQHAKLSAAQAKAKGTKPEIQSIAAKTRGMQQRVQARRHGYHGHPTTESAS